MGDECRQKVEMDVHQFMSLDMSRSPWCRIVIATTASDLFHTRWHVFKFLHDDEICDDLLNLELIGWRVEHGNTLVIHALE